MSASRAPPRLLRKSAAAFCLSSAAERDRSETGGVSWAEKH